MEIKERIKQLCKENSISVNKLETTLGFGTGYVSKLDKSTPNTKKIKAIADHFNVSVDYLMTGKTNILFETAKQDAALSNMDDRLKAYALKLADLPEDKKELVLKMIDQLGE